MPNISYQTDEHGREYAKWPGISKRVEIVHEDGSITKEPRKVGQMQLGLVIIKEENIFYKNVEGFYRFNPDDQSMVDIPPSELPVYLQKTDLRRRNKPVIVLFGGSYFLDALLRGIRYDQVLLKIKYQNTDRLFSMIQYYLLSHGAASGAETWYEFNFTKFLYPKANLSSQRISDFYAAIGCDENRRNFLLAHIKYLLKSTNEELCILIDSTGVPNKCRIPYTRVSNHEGDVEIEFRVIVVVQKSTGLPVYYEMIPGNVVDVSTVINIMEKLRQYGYKVEYALGDAAYSAPSNMERLVLSGVDFLTRLNPTYDQFDQVIDQHFHDLDHRENDVLYHGRVVTIVKVEAVIATDQKTGEVKTGYLYLCRDHNTWHSKSTHYMNSKHAKGKTPAEIQAECNKYGVFALVSTKDLPQNTVLDEYYMRQSIEQFFDYAKNYGNYLPARSHNVDTLKGHLLVAFVATFFLVLIKNRLNILDSDYISIPVSLSDEIDEESCMEVDTQQGTELLIRQEKQMEIFKGSPAAIFSELQFQMADVFDEEIVPSIQVAGATQMYKAYHIDVPDYVLWDKMTQELTYCYRDEKSGNHCTRKIAFGRKTFYTEQQLEEKRRKGELRQLQKLADKHGMVLQSPDQDNAPPESVVQDSKKERKKPGRPKGAKNKKTLEREAREAELAAAGKLPPKRKRGRPIGSKNKKRRENESLQDNFTADPKEKI